MTRWKMQDLTCRELREVLESRGYKHVPADATRVRMLVVIEADERGQVLLAWW